MSQVQKQRVLFFARSPQTRSSHQALRFKSPWIGVLLGLAILSPTAHASQRRHLPSVQSQSNEYQWLSAKTPEPQSDNSELYWFLVLGLGLAAIYFFWQALSIETKLTEQLKEQKKRVGQLESDNAALTRKSSALEIQLADQVEKFTTAKTASSKHRAELAAYRSRLALIAEMDPGIEAKVAAWAIEREQKVAEQAKIRAHQDEQRRAIAQGEEKIQTLLAALKGR